MLPLSMILKTNWMPIGLRKKGCITTEQKFQEPEVEVLQRKLQKLFTVVC